MPLILSLQSVICEVLQRGAHLISGRFLGRLGLAAGYEVLELTDYAVTFISIPDMWLQTM